MRYLVLSDIHANLDAFVAVLDKASEIGYDKMVFLGDAVGYGVDPKECLEILKDKMSYGVAGNHDKAIVNPDELSYFNEIARQAILWTREKLKNTPFIKFLEDLPYTKEIEPGIIITHSTISEPRYWEYILTPYDAEAEFNTTFFEIMLYGHTHIPIAFEYQDEGKVIPILESTIYLDKNKRYILNPGSVGQPRDGDNRASFAILDTEKYVFKIYRVSYPYEEQQKKMLIEGSPMDLIDRLEMGL